ncbi:MAG: DUF2382 domain-containing protein [Cyanobacteria bacterium J06621_11]
MNDLSSPFFVYFLRSLRDEESLVAGKNTTKTGNIVVGKRVESETASVSIPVEKKRVVSYSFFSRSTDDREIFNIS